MQNTKQFSIKLLNIAKEELEQLNWENLKKEANDSLQEIAQLNEVIQQSDEKKLQFDNFPPIRIGEMKYQCSCLRRDLKALEVRLQWISVFIEEIKKHFQDSGVGA